MDDRAATRHRSEPQGRRDRGRPRDRASPRSPGCPYPAAGGRARGRRAPLLEDVAGEGFRGRRGDRPASRRWRPPGRHDLPERAKRIRRPIWERWQERRIAPDAATAHLRSASDHGLGIIPASSDQSHTIHRSNNPVPDGVRLIRRYCGRSGAMWDAPRKVPLPDGTRSSVRYGGGSGGGRLRCGR